ncbi:hypothetical protein SCHPADRAFT_940861 [Schizopora paradoxa]|uniref:DUF6533 domain-containing protein n=1 Tax=Schizopora paradoxa TaxID=27342 RepID=A0A0H2RMW0_9AGAM|nr:hypothetical protein SCHPADRAFT_940861 [Schizopora paradoxa]
MSSPLEELQQAFEQIAHQVWLYDCVLVATFTVLVVEYFQTFEEEVNDDRFPLFLHAAHLKLRIVPRQVRFVWKLKTSLANILFLMNRYVAPVNIAFAIYVFGISNDLSTKSCYNDYTASATLCFFQMQAAYAVLCVRTCAAWGFARVVKNVLICSFIASTASQAYFIARSIKSDAAAPPGEFGTRHCLILSFGPISVWVGLIILVSADMLALALLLVKSVKTFRQSRVHLSLLTVMAKDGIAYFICVFALSLANLLVIVTPVPVVKEMFLLTQAAFQNALAVRLLLHLRTVNADSDPVSRGNMSSFQIKHTTEISEFSTLEMME